MAKVEPIMIPGLMEPVSHYCHGVRAGDRLWISGMVGVKADGTVPDDVVEQFEVALQTVDTVLRSQGGRPENIVKVQVFLTDISDRASINPIRQRYFGNHRPASTLVEVSALVAANLKVEIEAEAVLD
ncbi:MAG: RidA family protein [Chromatiales bacterium]|jgi:2-iminobutanoate/2-iminopropanoate deaminase|nr:RidA family protein [Chromatiales bacterium]